MGKVANRTREHLGTTDAAIIAARRRLIESAESLEAGNAIPAPQMPESYLLRAPALLLKKDQAFDDGAAERMWAARNQRRAGATTGQTTAPATA
jgi:hypothetical protein